MEQLELPLSTGEMYVETHPQCKGTPYLEFFEATARKRIYDMLRNDKSERKPSAEAVLITSKLLARKALRLWPARNAQS